MITKIAPGSAASEHPLLMVGNRIASVNGISMTGKGKDEVHAAVRAAEPGSNVVFQIKKVNGAEQISSLKTNNASVKVMKRSSLEGVGGLGPSAF